MSTKVFLLSHRSVTLNGGHGRSNQCQNVALWSLLSYQFWKKSVNIWTQATGLFFFTVPPFDGHSYTLRSPLPHSKSQFWLPSKSWCSRHNVESSAMPFLIITTGPTHRTEIGSSAPIIHSKKQERILPPKPSIYLAAGFTVYRQYFDFYHHYVPFFCQPPTQTHTNTVA